MVRSEARVVSGLRLAVPLACIGFGITLASRAGAASAFDGVYTGSQTLVRSDNTPTCSIGEHTTVTVKDGHFTRRWNAELSVDIQADGSFSTSATALSSGGRPRAILIKGQITSGKLEAEIGSQYCAAHLSLTKS